MKLVKWLAVGLLVCSMGLAQNDDDIGGSPGEGDKISGDTSGNGTEFQFPAPTFRGERQGFFQEDFEAGVPPVGWTVVDNEGNGIIWELNTVSAEGNYTNGTGLCAMANSDAMSGDFDTELITPVIDCTMQQNVALLFTANYQNFANEDFFEVDISLDGGATFPNNVLSWNEDHGGFFATPGEDVALDISTLVDGEPNVVIRFRYWDPAPDDWEWYVQIDDMELTGRAGLSIPTLSTWGLIAFIVLFMGVAIAVMRRKRVA